MPAPAQEHLRPLFEVQECLARGILISSGILLKYPSFAALDIICNQNCPKLLILLPPSPKCCDYRLMQP